MITALGFAAIIIGWFIAGHLVAVYGKSRSYMIGMTALAAFLLISGHILVLRLDG